MLGLPRSTEYGKRIPKQKFYDNLSISSDLKCVFVEQIATVYWSNKISADTLNVAAGEIVKEIEAFTIRLNQRSLDTRVLQQIDKQIPYYILFVLEYEDKVQAWIGYKEPSLAGTNSFKVNSYYNTEWMPPNDLTLKIAGLSMDAVYDGCVRQIAGERLGFKTADIEGTTESLKDAVERDLKRQRLVKEIAALESKIAKEKQFNKQVELNAELKRLRKELEVLK